MGASWTGTPTCTSGIRSDIAAVIPYADSVIPQLAADSKARLDRLIAGHHSWHSAHRTVGLLTERDARSPRFATACKLTPGGVESTGRQPVFSPLRPSVPDVSTFPRAAWLRSLRHALATVTDAELGYGDPRGVMELRVALADYVGRVRGAIASPNHVIVTNGYTQG